MGVIADNITVVGRGLAPTVMDLLTASPTFKHQCDAIARLAHVSVTIGHPVSPLGLQHRTRLQMRRDASGAVIAHIELPALAGAETLVNDFERILEQCEEYVAVQQKVQSG